MKPDIPIEFHARHGAHLAAVPLSQIVAEAERVAHSERLAKRTALEQVLRRHIEERGCRAVEAELRSAASAIDEARRGSGVSAVQVTVDAPAPGTERTPRTGAKGEHSPPPARFFELEKTLPDETARAWYERLVGLDDHKQRLLTELELLLFPKRLEDWSRKHHRRVIGMCNLLRTRVPLIILAGDVGTGKTALAETAGDALARRIGEGTHVHLLKVNTQVRGTGLVGEMSELISAAFVHVEERARQVVNEPILLLLDEADSLAARRDAQQMHHEDKAGLNTLLQRLDNLRLTRLPIAALFITNRPGALDPAVRRRAALELRFDRPNDSVRADILRRSVPEIALTEEELALLVELTGPSVEKNKGLGFTCSDLTDRLLAQALRSAYVADRPLRSSDLVDEARHLEPAPQFVEGEAERT